MTGLVAVLKSPRFALVIIAALAIYTAAFAWVPWSLPSGGPPPGWAVTLGLDHPFSASFFLVLVALLFASTLACTWGKRARALRLQRGDLPASSAALPDRPGASVGPFLLEQGFRRRGDLWVRHRAGLWGGWVLHVGLLVLIAGVFVQQAFFDTGIVELAEGESVHLRAPGALVSHERGLFAPKEPPELEFHLQVFDPFAREEGYAPDRRSQIFVTAPGKDPEVVTLERDAGAQLAGVKVFHGVPIGLALIMDVEGLGPRSVHLKPESTHVAAASLVDPAGNPARFVLTAERAVDDRVATGALFIEVQRPGAPPLAVRRGEPFRFGDKEARVTQVSRWGQYSYARAPGMFGVFAGFAVVLAGCLLLTFPAGVARAGAAGAGALVYLPRGEAALLADWGRAPATSSEGESADRG